MKADCLSELKINGSIQILHKVLLKLEICTKKLLKLLKIFLEHLISCTMHCVFTKQVKLFNYVTRLKRKRERREKREFIF